MIKKLLIALAIVLASTSVYAEEVSGPPLKTATENSLTFSYNFMTVHRFENKDREGGYNETNRFKGIRYNYDDNRGIGIAKGVNSHFEETFLIEAEFGHTVNDYLDVGANFFIATGYEEFVGEPGILPGVAPFARVKANRYVSVKVAYMNFMAVTGFVEASVPLDLK